MCLDIFQMFDVYCKEIRSLVEFAVPVWHSGLTQQNAKDIERVQRVAFQIILQDNYVDYQMACVTFNTLTLERRREKLCLTFANKNLKTDTSFFKLVDTCVNTRSKKKLVQEYKCRTSRCERTSLPFLAKLLNKNN